MYVEAERKQNLSKKRIDGPKLFRHKGLSRHAGDYLGGAEASYATKSDTTRKLRVNRLPSQLPGLSGALEVVALAAEKAREPKVDEGVVMAAG